VNSVASPIASAPSWISFIPLSKPLKITPAYGTYSKSGGGKSSPSAFNWTKLILFYYFMYYLNIDLLFLNYTVSFNCMNEISTVGVSGNFLDKSK